MDETMNLPEAVQFLLQQQAQFYTDLQAMREHFDAQMQELRRTVMQVVEKQQELTETMNAIAAAHIRSEQAHLEAHQRLEQALQRMADAQALLDLRAAETEAKLNALIDIVSRQQTPPLSRTDGPS